MVNHPDHYGGKENQYEVVKVCENWDLDKDAYLFKLKRNKPLKRNHNNLESALGLIITPKS